MTEKTPYDFIHNLWDFVAIQKGMQVKLWESEYEDSVIPPYAEFWIRQGLITSKPATFQDCTAFSLTEKGKEFVKLAGLFDYELSMVQQQLSNNFQTDPLKYAGLRKALAAYTDVYLVELVEWVMQFGKDVFPNILDFGGGQGKYVQTFLEYFPTATGVLYDKAPGYDITKTAVKDRVKVVEANFKSEKLASLDGERFDLIVASEVLHVLGSEERINVLRLLNTALVDDGTIVVVEQYPSLHLDWRLFDMTKSGRALPLYRVEAEAKAAKLFVKDMYTNPSVCTHYAIALGGDLNA